jgi:hypothetical protein
MWEPEIALDLEPRRVHRPVPPGPARYSGRSSATFARNSDGDPGQPTRSAAVAAGIVCGAASNTLTWAANASKLDPVGSRFAVHGQRPIHSSPGHPDQPSYLPLRMFPVECRWRIAAQSSNLITFHSAWWPHLQLASLALFSVGVNSYGFPRRFGSRVMRFGGRLPRRQASGQRALPPTAGADVTCFIHAAIGVRRGRPRTGALHPASTCPSPPALSAVPAPAPRHSQT